MAKKQKKEAKKKVKVVDVQEIDFGDMIIKQTTFSDGSSKAEVI